MGDSQLAAVMRRLLEDEVLADLQYSPSDGCYILSLSGTVNVDEDEAHAITEAQNG